jgi:hypothetical protein
MKIRNYRGGGLVTQDPHHLSEGQTTHRPPSIIIDELKDKVPSGKQKKYEAG